MNLTPKQERLIQKLSELLNEEPTVSAELTVREKTGDFITFRTLVQDNGKFTHIPSRDVVW